MRPRPRALAPLLALAGAAACAGAPPSAPRARVTPEGAGPALTIAAPPAPARWVDASGATAIGPSVDGGTLVLIGGRRALVAADGSVRLEAAPGPEPLHELAEVPAPGGQGVAAARRIVGRGMSGIYRFDDPLGAPVPLARSAAELVRLGGAPGLVAVWDVESDLPRFLDVETGQLRAMAGLPAPPLRAIAFRDAKEGAAVFEAAGLAVTADGGATWRLAAEATPGDALRASGLRLRRGELRAFVQAEGRDAPVDAKQARLGPIAEAPPPSADGDAPLLRWIRVTGRDPLEAAVASGAPLAPAGLGQGAPAAGRAAGAALAASHGLLAKVDLATGVVLEVAEFARGSGVNACAVGGTDQTAWIGCALSEDAAEDLYDPFGVLRVPLGAARLSAEAPALTRNGEADLRASPSGGVMLVGACSADEEGVACARQPSGKWLTIRSELDVSERGAGPLADGRIAVLRGLWEGDDPAPEEPGEGEGEGEPERDALKPRVSVIGEGAKERRGPAIPWPAVERATLRVVSPIEEGEDQALSFVLADDEGLAAVVQPPGREPAVVQRLGGATHARVHAGHGVAIGAGVVLSSRDGGLTWSPAGAPPRALAEIDQLGAILDEPGVLAVSAVGIKIDTQLRIGWGPPASAEPGASGEPPARPAEAPGAPLPRRTPAATWAPEQGLVCTTLGPAAATPPLLGAHQIVALLTRGAPPAPKGIDRRVHPASTGRWGMLDVLGALEEEAPAPGAAGPAKWTLRWFDPAELQGKPRSWTGPAPKGLAWGASVRSVSAQGPRALFSIRAGGKNLLVRVGPTGAETVEGSWDLLPGNEVVFGEGPGAPIAWFHDTALVIWSSGEAPRVIATVSTHATRTLGQPTRDGVPLLLGSADWSLARTLPIPPPAKAGASTSPAAPIPLDGWVAAPNLRGELTRLPACGPRPRGDRFLFLRSTGDAVVDGQRELAQGAIYDVRMAGAEGCVASFTALLFPDRAQAAAVPAKGGPAGGPVAWVRVDLAGKKAEGGERGLDVRGSVRRLSCSLSPRR